MRKTILLVRHAEPRLVKGTKQGLSAQGRNQTRALSKVLIKHILGHDSLILHSDTERTHETAVLIQRALKCQIQNVELRFKSAENLTANDSLSNYSNYKHNHQRLKIESPADYASRIINLLRTTKCLQIVIVGHEVPIRVLLDELTKHAFQEKVSHASCFRVIVDLDKFKNMVTKVERIV